MKRIQDVFAIIATMVFMLMVLSGCSNNDEKNNNYNNEETTLIVGTWEGSTRIDGTLYTVLMVFDNDNIGTIGFYQRGNMIIGSVFDYTVSNDTVYMSGFSFYDGVDSFCFNGREQSTFLYDGVTFKQINKKFGNESLIGKWEHFTAYSDGYIGMTYRFNADHTGNWYLVDYDDNMKTYDEYYEEFIYQVKENTISLYFNDGSAWNITYSGGNTFIDDYDFVFSKVANRSLEKENTIKQKNVGAQNIITAKEFIEKIRTRGKK